MNLIEAGMVYVAYAKETKPWAKRKAWPYLFILLFVLVSLITAKSFIDFLPALAQIFGTAAVWQSNPRTIRFIMLVPRPLWFVYNFFVGSYAGIVTEIFILISVLVGIMRFDLLGKVRKSDTV